MADIHDLYTYYNNLIIQNLERSGIKHRPKASTGPWLSILVSSLATFTFWSKVKYENSYSEICVFVAATGYSLTLAVFCLFIRLSMQEVKAKDFHSIYFIPCCLMTMYLFESERAGSVMGMIGGLTVGGLGTLGVPQLMSAFPYCFTVGEATTVMHSFILFLMSAVVNLPQRYHLPPIHDNDIITVLLQVGILYVVSVCLLCGYFPVLRNATYFYLMTINLLCFITLPILYIILDQNPVMWIISFVFSSPKRIVLVIYWATCVLLIILVIKYQISSKSQATSVTRKNFHIAIILVYIPGLLYDISMLYLASGVTFALLIFLDVCMNSRCIYLPASVSSVPLIDATIINEFQLIRFLKVPPLGEVLQKGFVVFADEKDCLLSLTLFYLVCGMSFPLWMPIDNMTRMALLSGVLTVGIGDTAASFVGNKWGSHKWWNLTDDSYKDSEKWTFTDKTYEGSIACFFSQVCAILILTCCGFVDSSWLFRSILAAGVSSVVEGLTDQIDNLVLPISMYLCLIV